MAAAAFKAGDDLHEKRQLPRAAVIVAAMTIKQL